MKRARIILLACGLPWAATAQAATCTAAATPLSFGRYDEFATVPTAITATIDVTCVAMTATSGSFTLAIAPGGDGFWHRMLRSAHGTLIYQLYTNAGMSEVWGDGTGGTSTVSGSYSLNAGGMQTSTYRIYGAIAPGQRVMSGAYSDPILVILKN